MFEAFVQCLSSLTDSAQKQPLVMFLDDVHWADRATLDWLGYLVRRLREYPLLLVLAYRPEDAPPNLLQLVAGWGREGIVHRIGLTRLSPAQATELFISLGGDPARATQLQIQSAGNPYFLLELSQTAQTEVPPALFDLIKIRLAHLPSLVRQVVQAAAILEPDFDADTLRRTAGRSEEETLDGLDGLLQARILFENEATYSFAHPLVAEVIRRDLSGARRSFLHRRAAEAREAGYATGANKQLAGRLVFHYSQAGNFKQAADWAERAAEQALAVAAPSEAVEFYRQVLQWSAPEQIASRQFGLGQALYRQGELANARRVYLAALPLFEAQHQPFHAAQVCLSLADTYLSTGSFDEVVVWAGRGQEYLTGLETGPLNAEAFTLARFLLGAGVLHAGGALVQAEEHLLEAAHLAARANFELGNLRAQQNELGAALKLLETSIQQSRQADDTLQEILSHKITRPTTQYWPEN